MSLDLRMSQVFRMMCDPYYAQSQVRALTLQLSYDLQMSQVFRMLCDLHSAQSQAHAVTRFNTSGLIGDWAGQGAVR